MQTLAISELAPRSVARVGGRISSVEVSPADGPAELIARVSDGTGTLQVVFMGRRLVAGVHAGQQITIEGRVVDSHEGPRIFNPRYELA